MNRHISIINFLYSPWIFWLILAYGIFLRGVYGIGWAELDRDSILYLQCAERIQQGDPQALASVGFPPLYPLCIAWGMGCHLPPTVAGYMISFVAGAFSLVAIYRIAFECFRPKSIAAIAMFLCATTPDMIKISCRLLRDSLYIAIMLWGIRWLLHSGPHEPSRHAWYSGLLFGFAVLTRHEGWEWILFAGVAVWLYCCGQGVCNKYDMCRRAFVLSAGVLLTVVTGVAWAGLYGYRNSLLPFHKILLLFQ